MSCAVEAEQTTPAKVSLGAEEKVNKKIDKDGAVPRHIVMKRPNRTGMFHVPKQCPGLRNLRHSKGKIVHSQVYAIPLSNPDMEFFVRKYWPEPILTQGRLRNLYELFLSRFPGRPEEMNSIAHLLVPLKSGGIWEPYGVVIANNFTQKGLDRMAHASELVREIHKIFEFDTEPGWYRFVNND
ncbi:hypothetical protein CVT24_013079 [Panaeolus cyanescens]|uniref:Uncharacterized protein n=1 Tax=Panaeolus cyanescens TaxID=181874 RepID=A0A409VVG0_9AGAR|nr:hypothetical protein CVT24_013079 [Panaeolus cyanescens]